MRHRSITIGSLVSVLTVLAWWGTTSSNDKHTPPANQPPHVHAEPPPEYQSVTAPPGVWTDPAVLARGRTIYDTSCAICHGERGEGDGPAAVSLTVKPASLRDAGMVAEMSAAYWFWRVSEGGQVEPFKSSGSTMPAWKHLSAADRWAVIAYQHSFSGHTGAHTEAHGNSLGQYATCSHRFSDKMRHLLRRLGPFSVGVLR